MAIQNRSTQAIIISAISLPHHFTVHVLRTNLCINTCVYAVTCHSLGLPGFQLFVSSADIKSSAKGRDAETSGVTSSVFGIDSC